MSRTASALTAEDRRSPSRRCIVTRQTLPKDELLRFVIGPESRLVPDLACKLPGRGLWVSCKRNTLAEAIKRNSFRHAAKQMVDISDTLVDNTQGLLYQRLLGALALARKGGDLVAGTDKIKTVLANGRVIALVHADDASAEGRKKLGASEEVEVFDRISRDDLCSVIGREDAAHLALLDGEAGKNGLKEIRRYAGFVKITPL